MPHTGLSVKLFADGGHLDGMLEMYANPFVRGFTTNPALMRKAGVSDYRTFARSAVEAIPDRPISFEVFSDEFLDMRYQAQVLADLGPNVFVNVPVTNTKGESSASLDG